MCIYVRELEDGTHIARYTRLKSSKRERARYRAAASISKARRDHSGASQQLAERK